MDNGKFLRPLLKISRYQRFSIHDGPGIRTTFFLKGCTLSCLWCHNPETISQNQELMWLKDKCKNCGCCVKACPNNAHVMSDGTHLYMRNLCELCLNCIDACPFDALDKTLYVMELEEIIMIIYKDIDYYKASGGGVTFSGGEPLIQSRNLKELFQILSKQNIHIAVDTSLYVPWESVEELIPYVNLWLVDIKLIDSALHKKYTGANNELILNNLKKLAVKRNNVIIRLPLIKNLNTSETIIQKTCEFIKDLSNVSYVELLPYHNYGVEKAKSIGDSKRVNMFETPDVKDIERICNLFKKYNIFCKYEH